MSDETTETATAVGAPQPAPNAVAEHIFTWPMALAAVATVAGWVAASKLLGPDSPWRSLLQNISAGMPLLIAQLGQMWHSSNARAQMAAGRAATAVPRTTVNVPMGTVNVSGDTKVQP